jgi:hypothetical protein
MNYKFLIYIIVVIFILGCTEMTPNEKNLCYSFSTRSYDYIPTCTNEETCYEKVDALFDTTFNPTQETKLYEVKNKIARSWFYYNKAIMEIKNISTHCKSGSIDPIARGINQMNFYLDKAFIELDVGTRQSFEIINFAEQYFTNEDIDLLKEEPLFDSLIELRQILSELENGPTNSNSYVSYYMEQINNYNQNNSGAYYPVVEKSSFWLSTYISIDNLMLEKIGLGQNGNFPFLSNYFKKTIDFLEFNLTKTESLKSLQSFPAAKFMLLYSKLGGEKNSSFWRFSNLINKISLNHSQIQNKKEKLIEEMNKLGDLLNNNYDNITQSPTKTFIKSKLLQSKIVTKTEYLTRIKNLQDQKNKLNQLRAKGELTLGKEISELKSLKNSYLALNNSIEKNVLSETENLFDACDSFSKEINTKLKTATPFKNYLSELVYLANKTNSSSDLKLDYCEKLILLNEEYDLGLTNYEDLEMQKIDSTKNCFDYLENTFIYYPSPQLEKLFNELKNTLVTEENIFFFKEACDSLKAQLNNELNSDPIIYQIINNLDKTNALFEEIEKKIIFFQDTGFEEFFEKNKKAFNLIKKSIYTNNQIDFSKLSPIQNELSNKLETLYSLTLQNYETQIISFVKLNIKINTIGNTIPLAGQKQNLQKRLILANSFREIKKSFFINLGLEWKLIISNSVGAKIENNQLFFEYLPFGKTGIDFNIVEDIQLIEEDKYLLITNQNSILQRIIQLKSKSSFSKIIIHTKKPTELNKTNLFKNGLEHSFIENDENIIFSGAMNKDEKITIYFYLSNLFKTNYSLINTYKTNNQIIQNYKILIKNNTNNDLLTTLTLPIKYNRTVVSYSLIDEKQTKLKVIQINDELTLQKELFLPKQSKEYYLTLKINNIYEYYQEELRTIQVNLEHLGEYHVSEEIKLFLELTPGTNYEKDAENLLKKAKNKLNQLTNETLSQTEIDLAKKQLEEKIIEIEEILKDAKNFHLSNTNQLEELINSSKLYTKSNNEADLFVALSNIEKFVYSVPDELSKNIINMLNYMSNSKVNSKDLNNLKSQFFDEKQIFDSFISHDLKKGNIAYQKMNEIYSNFTELEKEIIKANNEKNNLLENKIITLKKTVSDQILFLEKELSFSEEELIKAKIIPPVTNARLKKIDLELLGIDSLSLVDQEGVLLNYFSELTSAIDYLKTKTIDEYNSSIDLDKSKSQLKKAKTYIDNNQYLLAYLTLKENYTTDAQTPYYLIPIILIVIIGFFLRYKLKNEKSKSNLKKDNIEKEWN